MKIMVVRRSDDFMAYIDGQSSIWGCGKTISEAIGDLVQSHPTKFDIKIEFGW